MVNLATTNGAHYAGKVVGQNDFIAPLTSAKGVASKLGKGTGVVEAEYKGHYLILTWSEFVNGTTPLTKTQDSQLEQFSNDLVAGAANSDLSQRMVTGAARHPAASSPAASRSPAMSASAKASATRRPDRSGREVVALADDPLVRVRIDLSYDGTEFSGWAAQPARRTVEGVLSETVGHVLRCRNRYG